MALLATSSKWDNRFLQAAELVASWSPDPSTKVGAVAVSQDKQPISWGWNAFPRKTPFLETDVNKETKYKYVVHAEMNTIYNASRESACLRGSTLYIFGMPPCIECAKGIIQAGVSSVIFKAKRLQKDTAWWESYKDSYRLFSQTGVICEEILIDYEPTN